ncbi:ERI1 exoribonuclease 2-like [Amphiura filiformis]|uniref:ERI1 exoribonuclease 2-like n=1 Tax=Amphiura filiformis TaxID=82378 RepID=UPI003B2260F4
MAAMKSTKELARKLGLLRKRSCTSQQSRDLKKAGRTCQIFSYLVVIDFESTCWKDKKNVGQEIIEFPAVLLNTSTGEVESEFHTYVLPEENPILSDFCTEFTGITQAQVESGPPIRVCLSQFSRWLRKLEAEKGIAYNTTQDDSKKLCTFVTWSDWDLAICLHYECRRKQLVKPPALTSWIDLRATYKNYYQRKPQGLHGALQDVGIEFSGRQHSGLDDSRNTAKLAWRMICDGCVMKITRTMQRTVQKRPVPTKAIESNQASAQVLQTQAINQATHMQGFAQYPPVTDSKATKGHFDNVIITAPVSNVASYQQQMVWTATATISDARQSEDIYIAPASTQQHKEEGEEERYCNSDDDDDDFVTATQALAWEDKWGHSEPNSEQSGVKSVPGIPSVMTPKVALGVTDAPCPNLEDKSGNTVSAQSLIPVQTCLRSGVKDGNTDGQSNGRVGVKRPSPLSSEKWSHTISKPSDAKQVANSTQNKQSPILWTSYPTKINNSNRKRSEFKTPIGPAPMTRKSPFNTNGTLKTPPSSTTIASKVLRTPTYSPTLSSGMLQGNITPPMCGCGRRAKKNNVVSPGPNQGRGFYSCPNRRGGRSSEFALHDSTNRRSKQGCGYFKWESVVIKEKLAVSSTPVLKYKQTSISKYRSTPVLKLNYIKSTPTTPVIGYKPTPSPVGRLGQSYISEGVRLGNGSKLGGLGKRLGMSQRTVLKPPTLNLAPKSPFNTNGTLKTPPSSTTVASKVLRTPTYSPTLSSGMLQGNITPPVCGCGRRAKKNNVVSPGPNQGRGFYSCPNRRGGRSSEFALHDSTNRRSKQGCGYFKWESVVIKEKLAVSSTPVLKYKQTSISNYRSTPVLKLNYNKSTPTTPVIGYKPTPSPVGRLGQSYISEGVRLGNGSKLGGLGKRLGMSQRTVLKPPTLNL